MNKYLTLISLILIVNTFYAMSQAGTQRVILAEDFSSAYCPPSAPANVYFNSLMNINTSKVVKLTYQWNFGPDPMYVQNPVQLTARSNYYGVPYVPYALMDGSFLYPYDWTQAMIDSAYAIPAPFDIALIHSFNAAYDSIFISAAITCTQNITMTTPKFRCAMTEEHIHFTSPPGNNGETDFYDIMRAMYPDAIGTPLATSWTTGQTQTITFAEKIPVYIYDYSQIAVVAFIQDDLTKNVQQGIYRAPLSSVGMDEEMKENMLNVYPNPSSGILNIVSEDKHSIKIYSPEGSLLKKFNGKMGINTIDLSYLSSGIYIYKVQNKTGLIGSGKLIVQ